MNDPTLYELLCLDRKAIVVIGTGDNLGKAAIMVAFENEYDILVKALFASGCRTVRKEPVVCTCEKGYADEEEMEKAREWRKRESPLWLDEAPCIVHDWKGYRAFLAKAYKDRQ